MIFADEYYMGLALSEARAAAAEDEIPIGAIVVGPDGRILGRGHNQTERLRDVTAHAEMLAISAAAQTLGGKYLTGCTLYVTVEPCPMCAGAVVQARLQPHTAARHHAFPSSSRGYRGCSRRPLPCHYARFFY